MSKFDKNKVVKSYRKTIRFDEKLYSYIQGHANKYNMNFSDVVKNQLSYDYRNFLNLCVEAKITPEDRKMLSLILLSYAHSANNLNQATKGINQIMNWSWLDISQKRLDKKLDYISSQLNKVIQNFDDDQDVFDKFVNRVKKVR